MTPKRWILPGVVLILALAIALGPSTADPVLSGEFRMVEGNLPELALAVEQAEKQLAIRPNVHAHVRWADSIPAETEVAILYLHGFSGTWHDGSPAIERVAKELRANLFLARLHGHGLATAEPLLDFHPDSVYQSAVRALSITRRLGKRVVVIGTSTGATLGLLLAARYPELVSCVVNWSPNVRLAHPLSFLSNGPWGFELTRLILGGAYREVVTDDTARNMYWYMKYRAEAIPQLQALLEASMHEETFARINAPVLTMCWYKDADTQDSLVSVDAMHTMHQQLGTSNKHFVTLDAGNHEIGYGPESKSVQEVVARTVGWITKSCATNDGRTVLP